MMEASRREAGKAEGLFKTAVQSEKGAAALSSVSKNLGGLISALQLVLSVSDSQATVFSVGEDLAVLGAGILGGLLGGAIGGGIPGAVAGAVLGGRKGEEIWNTYASAIGFDEKTSPNFHDTVRTAFNNTLRNSFGFTPTGEGKSNASEQLEKRLSVDLAGVGVIEWPNGTRQTLETGSAGSQSELTFRKDGSYTKVSRYPDGRTGHHTVDTIGSVVRSLPAAPVGVTLSRNQFYVDELTNSLTKISDMTGVSTSTLMGVNPALGLTSEMQPIGAGQIINLPAPSNLIDIKITPDPQPVMGSRGQRAAIADIWNGFVRNTPTSHIRFGDGTLDKTDFVSARIASLATGGIRPGEFQLDPNAKPGAYLSRRYIDPLSESYPNSLFSNSAMLNGLSAMTTFNIFVDPILLDVSGGGVQMTGIEDGVLFDVDHSGAVKRAGWADRTTGILVVDDGTGQIVNASQMLSEYYGGKAGTNGGPGETPFKDGFDALSSVDQTQDGVIDSNDPIWNTLKVWIDSNHDGQSGGELKTLAELGITQISVAPTARANGETLNGNEVLGRGTFMLNGETRELMAVNFLADPIGNTFTEVEGGSRITSTTSKVSRTAYASKSLSSETLDAAALGVDNVYAGGGDTTLIASPSGSWLAGGGGSNTYQGGTGDDVFVISARDDANNIHGNGGRDTAIIVGDAPVRLNMAKAGLTVAEGGRGDDVIMSGGHSSAFIKGGQGNTTIIGGGGNDVLVGGSGRNTIIGGAGNAVIYAGPSGDAIYASALGSIIHAGGGPDRIFGSAGDDVIEAGRGDAHIDGGGGTNIVALHGEHGDYAITRTETGYTIADRRAGRDGTLTLKNVQKLDFSNTSAVDLTLPHLLPVSDALRVNKAGQAFDHKQPHLISAEQLLVNDLSFSGQGPVIASVGDAIGGTVALTEKGEILFTPDPTHTGVMNFKYTVIDRAGHAAATVVDLNSGKTAPMRATVTLSAPDVPTDPLVAQEWYLSDANVIPVWKDYTGKGVRIGQFETGGDFATEPEILDIRHPDLAPNIDPIWLTTEQSTHSMPQAASNHATAVAGVMVAAKNERGGVGVAYDATIGGHYVPSVEDATSLSNMVCYDVVNSSFSINPAFSQSNSQEGKLNVANTLLANANYAATAGRGGRGTIIVAAGGNNRQEGGSAQGSLINDNRFTIQVGAINAQSDLSTLQLDSPPFSNPGASLLVSAPGSNVLSTSIMLETDRGSTFGSAYSSMRGTSFATPIVSGVVALMLQANPNLGYRDVQAILALSAKGVRDDATQWRQNGARNWNGSSMHASHDYGFGTVDARAAVRLAESWAKQSTASNEWYAPGTSRELKQIVTSGSAFRSLLGMASDVEVEHAEVEFDADVGRLGDVTVKLISPSGTESVLLDRLGKAPAAASGASDADRGDARSGRLNYTFMSTHHWGERSGGNWALEVTNAEAGLPVTVNKWSLRLYGNQASVDNTYFYTDEYRSQIVGQPARAVLNDNVNGQSGGRNTLNAAAVSGDVAVDLTTGIASIGGAALTISQPDMIQNIVTGDGNDRLVAGDGGALLDGGRGTNLLVGGGGTDFFVVHRRANGEDTIEKFDATGGEVIDLVGFASKKFEDLALTQHGADVQIELGDAQSIVVKDQKVAVLAEGSFLFQDSFVAPARYVDSSASDAGLPDAGGTITLNGGATGVGYSNDGYGRLVASLRGRVYSHDAALSDTFVVEKQNSTSADEKWPSYENALRGFKHGVDKIDLSRVGITSFSDLTIEKANRATIDGFPHIHGVKLYSRSLGTANTPLELVYLDAINPAQLTESDFIFAKQEPTSIGELPASLTAEGLVQAMAAFSPPAAGTFALPPERDAAGQVALAANWH
jgi:subtilisin-like proprotein convertase family protein